MSIRLIIKKIKDFDLESDVLVVPSYIGTDSTIKTIIVPSITNIAIIKSSGKFENFIGSFQLD